MRSSEEEEVRLKPDTTSGVLIVLTTLGAGAGAGALARTLVGERLAACVSILPVMRSVYRWQGQVEEEHEQQLVIKTSAPRLEALKARLLALHPYETPELIVLEAAGSDAASDAYARWVKESTA